jgi:hypothetical protein
MYLAAIADAQPQAPALPPQVKIERSLAIIGCRKKFP